MRKQNYFDRNPIKDWTIAKDCEHIFLNTIEKQQRWQRIKMLNHPIMMASTPLVNHFKINLN